ncbi:MAG: radical SAM protein [Desulfohalobiaceae bacterium]
MRVLLISANTEQIDTPVLPIGMARVAAAAEHAGHQVRTLNPMQPEQAALQIQSGISELKPDIIGVSVRNIDDQNQQDPRFLLPQAKGILEECRKLSQAPIVLGGPGFSIFPCSALAYLGAEYGIQGEGEQAFPDLLARMAAQQPVKYLPGLILPDQDYCPPARRLKLLDNYPLPLPGIHLQIPRELDKGELWVPLQTRRGCPMQCSYCSTPAIEGRIMRRHSVQAVLENLTAYVRAGFKRFFFVDNTFNLPPSYAQDLCQAIIDAGLDISWQAIVYPAGLKPELVEKMARAGCVGVALGFESGNRAVLQDMNKRFGPQEVRRASQLFKEFGISRMGFLLLGGPRETKDTVEESIDFAKSLDLELAKLTAGIRIYPHTPLARQAVEDGIVPADSDLLHPSFYLKPHLDGWLQERVAQESEQQPGWQI